MEYHHPDLIGFETFYIKLGLAYTAKQNNAPSRIISPDELIDAAENGEDIFADDNSNFDYVEAPDGYMLVNSEIGFSRELGSNHLDFRIEIYNLFNVSYRDYTNRLRYYSDDIGRNFTLGLKYVF